MKTIQLTQNQITIVDDEDFEYLKLNKWCAIKKRKTYYAARGIWKNGKTKIVYMHHLIMKINNTIDHINGNTLYNRKENLRTCTNQENIRNSKLRKDNKSGAKGVLFNEKRNKTNPYIARITVNNKSIHLGYFKTLEASSKEYNKAAIKYFGKFARLNG